MTRAALLLATLALTGAARHSRDPFEGRVPGPTKDCVELNQQEGLVIADEHTITYRDGSRLWRTGPMGNCPALRPLATLVVEVYGGQVCRGDRFRVVEPGLSVPSGFCRFGAFTPYTPAPR